MVFFPSQKNEHQISLSPQIGVKAIEYFLITNSNTLFYTADSVTQQLLENTNLKQSRLYLYSPQNKLCK